MIPIDSHSASLSSHSRSPKRAKIPCPSPMPVFCSVLYPHIRFFGLLLHDDLECESRVPQQAVKHATASCTDLRKIVGEFAQACAKCKLAFWCREAAGLVMLVEELQGKSDSDDRRAQQRKIARMSH